MIMFDEKKEIKFKLSNALSDMQTKTRYFIIGMAILIYADLATNELNLNVPTLLIILIVFLIFNYSNYLNEKKIYEEKLELIKMIDKLESDLFDIKMQVYPWFLKINPYTGEPILNEIQYMKYLKMHEEMPDSEKKDME